MFEQNKYFLESIDNIIFASYFLVLLGFGYWLGRKERSQAEEYFLGGKGITISDDNLAVSSPKINKKFFLPTDDEIGEAFNGAVIHSCGNWTHSMPYLHKLQNILMKQGRHDRDQHAAGTEQIASYRRARMGKPLQSEDKQDRGKQIGQVNDRCLVHGFSLSCETSPTCDW